MSPAQPILWKLWSTAIWQRTRNPVDEKQIVLPGCKRCYPKGKERTFTIRRIKARVSQESPEMGSGCQACKPVGFLSGFYFACLHLVEHGILKGSKNGNTKIRIKLPFQMLKRAFFLSRTLCVWDKASCGRGFLESKKLSIYDFYVNYREADWAKKRLILCVLSCPRFHFINQY